MKLKKLPALLLCAALLVTSVLPAGAASSFSDVPDGDTAVHADILRLMGVADGVGSNRFNPGSHLTRAEFCAMVVKFMQKGEQVPLHATRTIFSDVTARHWSLGYVNLAASLTVKDGDNSIPLISGVGNGKFEPDSKLTLAQAATILLRVLGYNSKQAGAVWPQGYMNLAGSIGLTDGVDAGMNDPITRAQAARLFVNALGCKTGEGALYYTTLGTAAEDVILLSVNATTGDGSSDSAIRTSIGADPYLPAAGDVKPAALQGKRGALVLNDRDEIVTFVPDDSTAATIVLSGDAQPSYVKGTNGKQYTVPGSAKVYTAAALEGSPYSTASGSLKSGTELTMYAERGKIVAIYAGGSMAADSDGAVIVKGTPSISMFHQLTDGSTSFTVRKDRQTIPLSQLKEYDVVTYDSLTDTLTASDLRLTCVYEDAAPNAKAPETITVLGHTFPVLDSGWDTISDFRVGDLVTLLLTADGKVAGMAAPSGKVRSTAIGMVSSNGAELFLPNGGTIALTGNTDSAPENQLVTLTSSSKGNLTAVRLADKTAPGPFRPAAMTLGGHPVAAGVRVYEQVNGGAVAPISLSALDMAAISAADIASYRLNSSGYVDALVLRAVTGDAYTYGILKAGGDPESNPTLTVENGTGGLGTLVSALAFEDGAFGGAAKGASSLDGMPRASSVVELTAIKKVSPDDFFVSQGAQYVTAGGRTYRVSNDVECYKSATQTWISGDSGRDRLASCLAFSQDLTIWLDPIGERVRIVEAK